MAIDLAGTALTLPTPKATGLSVVLIVLAWSLLYGVYGDEQVVYEWTGGCWVSDGRRFNRDYPSVALCIWVGNY